MAGVNKVIIVGRLGQDPELRYTAGQQAVAKLNVATSEQWKDKQGQKQERTEWHRIVVWGKLAEICGQHLTKGRQVYVEGRLQTRQWEDKQGQKRYTTEVNANTVQFLGSAGEKSFSGAGASAAGGAAGFDAPQAGGGDDFAQTPQDFTPEPAFDSDEEIPF